MIQEEVRVEEVAYRRGEEWRGEERKLNKTEQNTVEHRFPKFVSRDTDGGVAKLSWVTKKKYCNFFV